MNARTVLSVFGTRPEAIKMAPVVRALAGDAGFRPLVCVTAQHRQMLDQVLDLFGIAPDYDLDLMKAGQDLYDVTADVLVGMRPVLQSVRPDVVLVQGDTTTCFAAALAAFYEGIPVGHVEAGLRTGNRRAPFPEEVNRTLVAHVAADHFAPTERARANLLAEGIARERVWITGNTVIDALQTISAGLGDVEEARWRQMFGNDTFARLHGTDPVVLITGHRRESFGRDFEQICAAIRDLAQAHPDWLFVYPVHLNPNVRAPVFAILSGIDNVLLIEPLGYLPFVWLMNRCRLILTDSGGIQEEAPSLGKPVLVMREVTERREAIEAGTALLVGADRTRIVQSAEALMTDPCAYQRMAQAQNPYGDGRAAERIVDVLRSLP